MALSAETVYSPVGKRQVDTNGSPVGVARMDAAQSYEGIGNLLQRFINSNNQEAWETIKDKIDYTYQHLGLALSPLDQETGMGDKIIQHIDQGKKLLFKPNIVMPRVIEPLTNGQSVTATVATEWPFIAALMRWFHDKVGIKYHQMAIGEAATGMASMAALLTNLNPEGKPVTAEATLEGKSGSFHGGWGFYFARKYLSETLGANSSEDPMKGYEESVAGTYIPPGLATDKLMIYDLNRIFDDETKGREVDVPGGVNYSSIMLHKAVVGGEPNSPEDMKLYPGCVLVNVPKFKVHAITLFTNIIKNLGIGLYPMQYAKAGGTKWDYSVPHDTVPGIKGGIPHEVWVGDVDMNTGFPKRHSQGHYMVKKTGGITATMIDIIKATANQGVFMIHVVDGIEAVNVDHMGSASAARVPEGVVFAGLDPVAADLLCARYMFSNVGIKEAVDAGMEDGHGGFFPQSVPVAVLKDNQITTQLGLDCPLSRDVCFQKAEERELGIRQYYVVGHDATTDKKLVSIEGHLGLVKNGQFADLVTETLFFDMFKVPWDLQKTSLSYLDAVDNLTGTSLKTEFLSELDENSDGILTYEELGKKGAWSAVLHAAGMSIGRMATEKHGFLKMTLYSSKLLKCGDPELNDAGHDVFKEINIGATIGAAMQMSQLEGEMPDSFVDGLTFGNGKWPSFQMADMFRVGMQVFGDEFPDKPAIPSLYSTAMLYADLTQNAGRLSGDIPIDPDPGAIEKYVSGVKSGSQKLLDFTLFVPEGMQNLSEGILPNVAVTDDPGKVFTVSFSDGKEVWS